MLVRVKYQYIFSTTLGAEASGPVPNRVGLSAGNGQGLAKKDPCARSI